MATPSPLSDQQIADLLREAKPIPEDFVSWLKPRKSPNHRHRQISKSVTCQSGREFAVYGRMNLDKPNDFSLGLRLERSGKESIGLIRCNGWHPVHFNELERGTPEYKIAPNTFHIHTATERYLAIDKTLEKIGYATPTTEYTDFLSALEFFVEKFGFVSEKTGQPFPLLPLLPGATK